MDRARRLDPEQLHESVSGEWSFIQTLRHLAFASESWVGRCILGDRSPWHPLSLPWDQMDPHRGSAVGPRRPPLARRGASAAPEGDGPGRGVVDDLTDEQLASETAPLVGPGWPPEGETFPVRECLLIVLNEEW